MAKKIFINYRRADAEGDSGRLHDRVAWHAGRRNVFWDRDDLGPGEDYVDRIAVSAAQVDVVLAVIGPEWASEHNLERLHEEGDWVRRELEAGVRSTSTQMVPVLVRGATWPPAGELPASLQPMLARQAWEIRADQFNRDVSNMLRRLKVPNWRVRVGAVVSAVAIVSVIAGFLITRDGEPDVEAATTSEAVAASTSAPTTAPTQTTVAAPTTSAPPPTAASTTTTADPGCGPVSGRSLPVEAQNVDSADGDFDGDGRRDVIFAYNVAGSPDISRFLVQLDTGYTHEFVDDVFFQLLPPQFMGALDINGDGMDEAFVRYAGGASTNTVRVIAFANCRLATLGEFLVGGSVGFGAGLECPNDDADLVEYEAELNSSATGYVVGWRRYRIAGDILELIDEQPGTEVPFGDPLENTAYGLDCGPLSF